MQQKMCCRHLNFPLTYINIQQEQAQLWCDECLMEKEDQEGNVKVKNLILINRAISNPEFFLSRLNISNSLLNYFKEYQNCQEYLIEQKIKKLEQQIEEIKKQLQYMFSELQEKTKQIFKLRQKFKNELFKIVKFEEFQQIIKDINETNINPDAVNQIEQRLHKYFSNLQLNNSQQLNQQLTNIVEDLNVNICKENVQPSLLEKLDNQFLGYKSAYQNIQKTIGLKFNNIGSNLIDQIFCQKILAQMKDKVKKEPESFQQIYKGSKDGLNAPSFWSKVNGKSNLLMIFKSQSNYVFGAYSPCCWNQNLGNYVQDGTNSSFLFSQTHDQIYPIKTIQYTIYCNSGYGPTFGSGHDLNVIGNNFQDGYSNLGNSYYWDKYPGQRSSHLFGSDKPNLVELEIFQVTFK